MAFLTNLGVSNGGYPAIRLETATITKNGVYTAPRGVAYSQVNVNVPSSGGDIPYVEVLPAVDEYNEGDVVYLTDAYSKLEPATLYAYSVEMKVEYASDSKIIYERTEGHTHFSNLLYANYDYGMMPYRELFNDDMNHIRFTYDESMHFTVADPQTGENTGYMRVPYYDIANCSMMQVFTNVNDDADHIYVNDNEGLDFESRVFAPTNPAIGFFPIQSDVTSISRTDESHIAITVPGNNDPIIYELDTEHQFTAGREVYYAEGYYKLDGGNWVLQVPKYNLPTAHLKVYNTGEINIENPFFGLVFHNICDKGEYLVYSGYTGWQVYTENYDYLDTIYYSDILYNNWNDETEIGIGIVVPSVFNAETNHYGGFKLISFTPIDYELHFDN